MAKKKKPAPQPSSADADAGQADRLARIERACGYDTAAGFAQFIGVEPRRWYNFKNGHPLSRDAMFKLVQRVPGLTSDYLYFGREGGLSLELARRLGIFDPPSNTTS